MKKLLLTALVIAIAGIALVGCDQLIAATSADIIAKEAATQATKDNAVAQIEKVDGALYFDKAGVFLGADKTSTMSFVINQDAGTIAASLVGTLADDWKKAISSVVLTITTVNKGTTNYVKGTALDFTTNKSVTVTSVDKAVTKTYTLSVSIMLPPATLGIIGSATKNDDPNTGWNADKFVANINASGKYVFITYFYAGEFKLRSPGVWTGTNVGIGAAVAGKANTWTLVTGDAGANVPVATAGFYLVQVDFVNSEVSRTAVTSVSTIGDAVPGDWDTDTALVGNTATDVFSAVVACDAGTWGWFIRLNASWDLKFTERGAQDKTLELGAPDNITSVGTGNYLISFNGRTLVYSAVAQ